MGGERKAAARYVAAAYQLQRLVAVRRFGQFEVKAYALIVDEVLQCPGALVAAVG